MRRARRRGRHLPALFAGLLLFPACGGSEVELAASEPGPEPPPPAAPRPDSLSPVPTRTTPPEPEPPARLGLEVLEEIPHDPGAFTQGLLLHDGSLYESTGNYGASSIRRLDPTSGEVLARRALDPSLFAEGLALVEGRLVQLTWKAGLARVLDPESLEEVDLWSYQGEGWGLADDGRRLVMSDGSATLQLRDRKDFRVLEEVRVLLEGRPLAGLNELEWAEGRLYANVWTADEIVRIDMDERHGTVEAVVDASELRRRLAPEERARIDVLNGIAYDPESKTFLLTGKYWPRLFRVRFVPL